MHLSPTMITLLDGFARISGSQRGPGRLGAAVLLPPLGEANAQFQQK